MRTPPKTRMNLVSARFGRLIVIAESERKGSRRRWLCRCDCGAERVVTQSQLTTGKTSSCGCLHREQLSQHRTKHGNSLIPSPEYRAWKSLRGRCNNPNDARYAAYGGRGITVDPAWETFEAFLRDMGPRPSDRHSLDRIDNDGEYGPKNCRWATASEQRRNQRPRPVSN